MPIKLSGLNSGLDTDAIVKELMSAHSLKLTKVENKKTKNNWTQEKWKELNTKIYALYTDELSKARLASSYKTKKAMSSNADAVGVDAGNSAAAGAHTIEVNRLASAQYVTGVKADKVASTSTTLKEAGMAVGTTLTITGSNGQEKTLEVTENTTVNDFISTCKSAGLNANFDTTQKRFFISSASSGEDQKFSISASDVMVEEKDENGNAVGTKTVTGAENLSKLGLGVIDKGVLSPNSNQDIKVVQAQDAQIVLDGATLNCSSNETEVNGIKLSLKQVTTAPVTVTVSNDSKDVYDMVKGFINTYNSVLGAMNKAYYAGTSKGYEPLTDEEKEVMTEDQIEKWETKIKDSLLRRDSTLGSMITSFKSIMSTSVTASNGKTYSLSSLGICTSTDYTEKGLLHIKGDADDSTYSDKQNTLMKMIEEEPEIVAEVMQKIASNLYETMTKKMSSTSLSSAMTFYNDKQLSKIDKDYDSEISKLKQKLQTIEDRYYKQFTAMEKALAKLNQQQSNLASMLG